MIPVHIDFETRSTVDLKRATTHIYATDPTTDVHCMAYAVGDGPVQLWKRGEPFPLADAFNPQHPLSDAYFIAHNAHFELSLWNDLCVPRYGWPPLPVGRTFCTMAMAYAMALPGSLENAANATGLEVKKDMEGRRLMLKMATPRRIEPDGTIVWWEDEERLNRLYDYCKNDVIVERELEKRLRPLPEQERKLWILDYEINNRGIQVDISAIKKAITTITSEKTRLDDAIHNVTKHMVKGSSDLVNLKDFIAFNQVKVDGLAKSDIRDALATTLPPEVREALLIRQEGAKSSTAKLKAMIDAASPDDRVRGTMQYHGAGTGRWAGRKIQPHNMPRGELGITDFEDVIAHFDQPAYLSTLYGPPLTVISDALRSLIIPRHGHDLIAADFSSIEARVLAWLAGEQHQLDIFIRNEDVYVHAAAAIFCVPVSAVTKQMRAVGKVAVLALGYQGGVGAFQTMAKGYNVDMTPAFEPLISSATDEQIRLSQNMWEQYVRKQEKKNLPVEMTHQVFIASDLTKRLWRAANPIICEYWYNLEGAAMAATRDPKTHYTVKIPGNYPHRQISFIKSGSFLWCKLPSGRRLCYPYPKISEIIPPWNEDDDKTTKPALVYMGVDGKTKTWGKQIAYGGLLAENVTQAVARDFLVEAIFNAEAHHYPVIFHVHDELVTEVPCHFGSTEELETIITAPPAWGFDCPIAAEGWRGTRYRK